MHRRHPSSSDSEEMVREAARHRRAASSESTSSSSISGSSSAALVQTRIELSPLDAAVPQSAIVRHVAADDPSTSPFTRRSNIRRVMQEPQMQAYREELRQADDVLRALQEGHIGGTLAADMVRWVRCSADRIGESILWCADGWGHTNAHKHENTGAALPAPAG